MERQVKPVHMALCGRCAAGIRQSYGERAEDHPGRRVGICGFCGSESTVQSFDLWPKIRRSYRTQTGGGERSRAGGRR